MGADGGSRGTELEDDAELGGYMGSEEAKWGRCCSVLEIVAATTPWLQLRRPPFAAAPLTAPLWVCSTQRLVDGCPRAGRGATDEVRSSCAGANTTNKHSYTEVLCIQEFERAPYMQLALNLDEK